MTALNIVKSPNRIVVISDGASYDDEGTLLAVCDKVAVLPHYPGFIMQSGGTAWTPAIVAMVGFAAQDTDEMFEKIECILPEVQAKFSGLSSSPMGRVLFGGWSNSRNSMRLGCVFSDYAAELVQENRSSGSVVQPDAFTLHEFEGDQLLCQPSPSDRDWIDGYGRPIHDVSQIADIEEFASFLLKAERAVASPDSGARGVGGFGQITTITPSDVSSRVFERWNDEVGEVMLPIKPDWAAWRATRSGKSAPSAAPAGMSRQQRRALEARQRKGTLRAV